MKTEYTARRSRLMITAPLLAFALVLAACSTTDDGSAATDGPEGDKTEAGVLRSGVPIDEVTTGGVDGCGSDAVGDPSDMSGDRLIARCEPGSPQPEPLSEKKKLRVASMYPVPSFGAFYLADALGEFEKENLEIEVVPMLAADAFPLLATGEIDVIAGASEASLYNAIEGDLDVRVIMGNVYGEAYGDIESPQQGIWARRDAFNDPENPDLADLKGKTLGTTAGFSSITMMPMELALNDAGISLTDLRVEQVPSDQTVTGLENNALQAAWVLDPYWNSLADSDDFVLVATGRAGEQLGSYMAGPNLLEKDRDAGIAFARAIIRTINTHLRDGFKHPGVIEDLADALEVEVSALEKQPDVVYDWEHRMQTAEDAQKVFKALDQLNFETPLTDEEVSDRSLYLDAVGAQ